MAVSAQTKPKPNPIVGFLPILQWLPHYKPAWLRFDLIAGLTIWAVMVPEALAYAGIAEVPPLMGLYTVPLPLIFYAIFGTSRLLVVGPDSATALLSAAAVGLLATQGTDQFNALTSALAVLVGMLFLGFGLLRLGWVASFISAAVMTGFLEGIMWVTIIGQVPKLLGIPGGSGNFFDKLGAIIQELPQTNPATLALGVVSLLIMFGMKRYLPKLPSALTVVVLTTLAVGVLDLTSYGVDVTGSLQTGLPPIGLPQVSMSDYVSLLPGALSIVLLGYVETLGSAKGAALKGGGEIEPNQELVALGPVNVGAGLTGGFIAVGSLSKTSVAMNAGGKSQIAYIICAVLTILTLLFLMPLFTNLPHAALGAIVIEAMLGLDQTAKLRRLARLNRMEFALAIVCFLGVLTLGVLQGVLVAVILSLLVLIKHASSPATAVLGQIAQSDHYRDVKLHPEAQTYPGLLIYRFDAALVFPNAAHFADDLQRYLSQTQPPVTAVLVNAETINAVDVTGAEQLINLHTRLTSAGIGLYFAEVKDPVRQMFRQAGVEEAIGQAHFFESVRDGVEALQTKTPDLPPV